MADGLGGSRQFLERDGLACRMQQSTKEIRVNHYRWTSTLLAVVAVCSTWMPGLRAEQPSKADTQAALLGLMEQNMAACTEENMDKLLALMSSEMPNRQRFIATVDSFWSVEDTYNRIDSLEVLNKTMAPMGRTKYPYATARVRQTTFYVTSRDKERAIFRQICEDGRCEQDEMEHLMAVAPRNDQTEYEALFKHENGEWKLVANVSIPVPAGSPPKYPRVKRSVF